MGNALKGKHIVITRSVKGGLVWKKYFEHEGAVVHCFPTIKTKPVSPTKKIETVLSRIRSFDWIVFTSAEGVRAMRSLARALRVDISPARMARIAVIGKGTATAVRRAGYRVGFQPSNSDSKTLAQELTLVKGRSILLLRTSIASEDFPRILTARGRKVTDLSIYATVPIKKLDPKFLKLLRDARIDYLTFASPSAVNGLWNGLSKELRKKVVHIPAVAIGPSVKKLLKKKGFDDVRVAKKSTIKHVADAMI
ncbi:MAG TPA: uroporphyrinogen-III synthase [Candidatus Paceibacterota bacterium]|nr:uroporphyrinogen-III synthase [Candidatus Paceibacterota bacterium]